MMLMQLLAFLVTNSSSLHYDDVDASASRPGDQKQLFTLLWSVCDVGAPRHPTTSSPHQRDEHEINTRAVDALTKQTKNEKHKASQLWYAFHVRLFNYDNWKLAQTFIESKRITGQA